MILMVQNLSYENKPDPRSSITDNYFWYGAVIAISAKSNNVIIKKLPTTDPCHKSHNALDKYPTLHHFVAEMCTFLLQNGAPWDMVLVHCGICASWKESMEAILKLQYEESAHAHFCYKMVHYGIQDWCIVGFVN